MVNLTSTSSCARALRLAPMLALFAGFALAGCAADEASEDSTATDDAGRGGATAGGGSAGGSATGGEASGGSGAVGGEPPGGGTGGTGESGGATGGAGGLGAGGEGGAEPAMPVSDPRPLDAAGPYRVGYRQSEVTYTPAGSLDPRTLRLALWYPTDDAEGTATSYLLGRINKPDVFTDAGLAAVPPAGDAGFPVLVFSHGSGGLAEQSFFFTEFFASRGFVVLAPDHTGNTFSDGGDLPPEMFYLRPQDITAVLDAAYEGLEEGDALVGHLGERVLMAGHSFGGYTTLSNSGTAYAVDLINESCGGAGSGEFFCQAWNENESIRDLFKAGFLDERIDAAIPMAPIGGPAFDFGAIDLPVLLVTGGRDETLPDAAHGSDVWRKLDGAADVRLDFPDAGHFSFANICTELPGVVMGDGCDPTNTPPAEVHRVVNAASWVFVEQHLYGLDAHADVLSGSSPLSDDAVLTPKE